MAKPKSGPSPAIVDDTKWRTESDLRTIRTACEIMKDSARLTAVKKMIKDEKYALEKLEDLEGLRRYSK